MTVLEIKWGKKNSFAVDMDRFLPCTQKEFKMVLDMIDKAENIDELAGQIYDYITGQLEKDLIAVQCMIGSGSIDSYKKKMAALRDLLVSRYDIKVEQPEEQPEEKIKVKSSIVYIFKGHFENMKIESAIGWTFKKAGYTFDLVKYGNGSRYQVKFYGLDLNDEVYKSQNAAVNGITDKIISIIDKNAENVEVWKKRYDDAMIAAGYMDPVAEPEPVAEVQQASEEIKAEAPAKIAASVAAVIIRAQYAISQKAQYVKSAACRRDVRARATVKSAIDTCISNGMSLANISGAALMILTGPLTARNYSGDPASAIWILPGSHTSRTYSGVPKSAIRTFSEPTAGYLTGARSSPTLYQFSNGRVRTTQATADTS